MKEKEIQFTDYAPLNQDDTKEELAKVYRQIILDIVTDKEK